ncbi:MAG: flavin reductase [Rikenellaceae bacterium]|jgi:flavin reductase (DIM6/NTAB) family NADH-FMN oxidoreductase RutF|nr:flavin reductase [Rikenellaceae bacterium]
MKKIDPKRIEGNFIEKIGSEWMLVTAGKPGDYNTMTASWGGVGELWHKPVAFVFIRPQRYTYGFTEREDMLTLSFPDHGQYQKAMSLLGSRSGRDGDKVAEAGLTPVRTPGGLVAFEEASLVLECRKLYAQDLDPAAFVDKNIAQKVYPGKDFHRMYIVEIVAAYQK